MICSSQSAQVYVKVSARDCPPETALLFYVIMSGMSWHAYRVSTRFLSDRPFLFFQSTIASMRRGTNNRYEFNFDRVFQPTESQACVFDEISQLVQVCHERGGITAMSTAIPGCSTQHYRE